MENEEIVPGDMQNCTSNLRIHRKVRLPHLDHELAQKVVLAQQKHAWAHGKCVLIGILCNFRVFRNHLKRFSTGDKTCKNWQKESDVDKASSLEDDSTFSQVSCSFGLAHQSLKSAIETKINHKCATNAYDVAKADGCEFLHVVELADKNQIYSLLKDRENISKDGGKSEFK